MTHGNPSNPAELLDNKTFTGSPERTRMAALLPGIDLSPTRRWSLAAGLYMYACGTVIALALNDVLVLFGEVIGLAPPFSMLVLAVPALVIAPLVWWRLVERPAEYSSVRGGAFGLFTALLTAIAWILRFVTVWGAEMLAAGPVLLIVGFVLAAVSIGGVLAGTPFMFLRRRMA